jgi:hypothetical protein
MNGGHNRGQLREDVDEISSTHPTTVPSSSPLIVHILGSGEDKHQIPFQIELDAAQADILERSAQANLVSSI